MFSDLRRMRLLCGLRQFDVAAGTGVALYKISMAERGADCFTRPEKAVVITFLQQRWNAVQEFEMRQSPSNAQEIVSV